jgi:hypothetical protein
MDYEKAFRVLSTYVDLSVNTSMSEETRADAHHCAYWFKQIVMRINTPHINVSSYIRNINQCEIAHNNGMVSYLQEIGFGI